MDTSILGIKRGPDSRVYCKINHVIANASWLLKFGSITAQYLNLRLSNHSHILMEIGESNDKEGRPFKFVNT